MRRESSFAAACQRGSNKATKLLVMVLCIVPVMTGFACAGPASTSGQSPGWAEVWRASFSGPTDSHIDTRYWKYDTGRGIFGDGEIEEMTRSADNVRLDGHGVLDITAVGHDSSWTSGRIQTRSSAFAPPTSGEMMIVASIMQPRPANGIGYWPAFWMLGPGSWPEHGEIDIMEDVNGLSEHSATFNCGNTVQRNPDGSLGPCHEPGGLGSGLLPCPGCQDGFHTYSIVIDRRDPSDQQVRWYLDGRMFFRVGERQVGAKPWVEAVDHGFSIGLELAIGGSYPDYKCQCTAPNRKSTSGGTMSVRYVAVYDRLASTNVRLGRLQGRESAPPRRVRN